MSPTRRNLLALLLLMLAAGCAAEPADPAAAGERLYRTYCIGCHSLDPGGPDATGPTVAAMLARAAQADDRAAWLRLQIVSPNAEVVPGYPAGLMPATYGSALEPGEIDALATYLLAQE
jgi:mono/diheme cytochrome c family protein